MGSIAPPSVLAAYGATPQRSALPTFTFSSATSNLLSFTNGSTVNQAANVAIENVKTSDGLSFPTFGFTLVRALGSTVIDFQFLPSIDPNLRGIPGLTQNIQWVVDPSQQTVSSPPLAGMPPSTQEILFTIAANLASICTQGKVVSQQGSPLPVWSITDVISVATQVTNLMFQPSPILWSQFIGARQTSVAFQTGGGATVDLPAVDSDAGALAANATWGIGPATYDLNHNGQLFSLSIDSASKIGNFVAGSADFQKVEFDSAFTTCGNNASKCSQYGHLYQWQNGNWVQMWTTPAIPALFLAQTIVGDFDADGRLEVAVEPWYDIQVYDLLTGQLKTSAQFTPQGAESGRGYGWSGAFDLNAAGKQELIALGDFQNFIAVMGWQNGKLVKLWDHLIEVSVEARQTVHVPGAYPVQDIDGDGKLEIVTSIYNETGDGQWHVVARDGMKGTVLLDLPRRFLLGVVDVNGDGSAEMFTTATNGLQTPEYGQIDVVSFHGRTLKTLLELNGTAVATQQVQSLPLNINTSDQLSTIVVGPISQGALPVFFTSRLTDQLSGTVELTAWQWANGALVALGTITGPNLQVVATRAAEPGSPGFLITAVTRGNTAGSILASGVGGSVVQSYLIPAPRSSAVVGHLRPADPPTVIVQDALEELVAFRPSSVTGTASVLWTHLGRGGTMGSDNYTGQPGYSGPLLASLTGDGTLQTIASTRGPTGQARVVAIRPDGTDLWISDFDRFPGAPPNWNEPGVTLLFAGRFRYHGREDVAVATRRGAQNSEELNALDGRTGQLLWNDVYGNTPGTSPNQRGAGEGQMAVYDWNGDGLDEMVNEQTDVFWVKDGSGKNLIDRSFEDAVFPNLWAFYGIPAVADFQNNGTDTILFGASTYLLGLMNSQATPIWYGSLQAGTPAFLQGIADLDGDGTLSLLSAGVAGAGGQSTLKVQRSSTGEVLWSIPLPGCGQFGPNSNWTGNELTPVTVGDINGDGRDEAIFACGTVIYVAGANPGNRSGKLLWSLDLGTYLGTPILADAEGNGRLEIIVVGSNGFVYGVGSLPSSSPRAPNTPVIAAGGVVGSAAFRPGQIAPGAWFTTEVAAEGVVKSATLPPGQVAPGGWFTIEGANLGGATYHAAATPLPQQLGGTVVTVNGQIARLNYVDSTQINAEMPPDMPLGPATIMVTTKAGSSAAASVQIVPALPEIFQYGLNRAVAQNASNSRLNGPDNPVPAGGSLVVYFTGGGLVNGDRRTGVPAPLTQRFKLTQKATVTIGGLHAPVAFSGLTQGSIGLYEVDVTVPATLSPGDHPVAISVGGITSSPALISVK